MLDTRTKPTDELSPGTAGDLPLPRPDNWPLPERRYSYSWPRDYFEPSCGWRPLDLPGDGSPLGYEKTMPEDPEDLVEDSRWPAFFPSPTCLVTTTDGINHALEREVGASIVNRFPYVVALSFCRESLSARHHARTTFMKMLEKSGKAVIQFMPPGLHLDQALEAISSIPEEHTASRIASTALPTRSAATNDALIFEESYLAYEVTLARCGKDFEGNTIYPSPWIDVGSHRVYFLEINAIQLRQDIAEGRSRILWRSLPQWSPLESSAGFLTDPGQGITTDRYQKGYTPHYSFPSLGTVAFEADQRCGDFAVKLLPSALDEQVELDNDRARWPCFFPSSLGMITSRAQDGTCNLMPCGSTMVVSRYPLTIATCISYAKINERYAPRTSLEIIREAGRFGCGVPYIHDPVVAAIQYAGNMAFLDDPNKIANSGLAVLDHEWTPVLPALPIHFHCAVVGEIPLGTHVMFLGQVRRISVRSDLTPDNPLSWYPWATIHGDPDPRPVDRPEQYQRAVVE